VSILRAGRTVQHGTLAELRHLTRTTVVAETRRQAGELDAVPGVAHVERTDGRVRFDVDTDHLDEAMSYLAALEIRSLVAHPPTLEELFLRQYGDRVGVPA
jgi:ABC-2 type transport system ATP-binding protein